MSSALSNIRVIELTSFLAGPYCSLLLADMGADVIKIERPGMGDDTRRMPPFVNGESGPFMQYNRNKRSVVLDLKSADGLAACLQLVDGADVLVENFRPGTLERLGLGYEALAARNPRLVYCSISGFGQTGPYSDRGGFDLMAQAMSGLMSICGEPDGPPWRLPIPISDEVGGMYGALGILCALVARERSGKGQAVDVSLLDSVVSLGVLEAAEFAASGRGSRRLGQGSRNAAPYQVFPSRDGWFTLGAASQALWERLCDVIDAPHLVRDERFADNAKRITHQEELAAILTGVFERHDTAHWMDVFEGAAIPAAPVLFHDQVLTHPQTVDREMMVPVDHPVAGASSVLGTPIKLSETPGAIRCPAPTLGQHTAEVLAELRQARP